MLVKLMLVCCIFTLYYSAGFQNREATTEQVLCFSAGMQVIIIKEAKIIMRSLNISLLKLCSMNIFQPKLTGSSTRFFFKLVSMATKHAQYYISMQLGTKCEIIQEIIAHFCMGEMNGSKYKS